MPGEKFNIKIRHVFKLITGGLTRKASMSYVSSNSSTIVQIHSIWLSVLFIFPRMPHNTRFIYLDNRSTYLNGFCELCLDLIALLNNIDQAHNFEQWQFDNMWSVFPCYYYYPYANTVIQTQNIIKPIKI